MKSTYTKEEVISILTQFADDCEHNDDLTCYDGRDIQGNKILTPLNEWIETNL